MDEEEESEEKREERGMYVVKVRVCPSVSISIPSTGNGWILRSSLCSSNGRNSIFTEDSSEESEECRTS